MLKKEVSWIQPPTSAGIESYTIPKVDFEQMLDASKRHPEANISQWSDIDRIDIRPAKGVAKLRSKTGWEVQVDTQNGEVLSVAYRRSDVIEQIHDGSYFSESIKLFIFLPTGILLIVMWGTGVYLFLLPRLRKWKKSQNG